MSKKSKKSFKLFNELVCSPHFSLRSNELPGSYVEKLLQNKKFATNIRNLKSNDFINLRPDALYLSDSSEVSKRKEISKLLIEFDKRFLK